MGKHGGCIRQRLGKLFLVAGAVVALLIPTIAFAATASFSSRMPGSGSRSTNTRPTISVSAYDRYGVRGSSNFYMSIDRQVVRPTVTYLVTGVFDPSHPDYRRMKISYRPPTALKAGSHRVYVKVKDRRGYTSSTTWYFTVTAPEAPYSASFSSAAPSSGSASTVSMPTISVAVSDKYGVTGTGKYALFVDGSPVATTIRYATSGVYTNFTLSHKIASPLSIGTHTFRATVTDTHGHATSQSWTYTVNAPEPVYQEMPVAGASCSDCHAGYPAAHPMTACASCHGAGAPSRPGSTVPMTSYVPGDTSAHTLACSLESPCHGGGGAFPHSLDSDCARCHTGGYAGIPGAHSLDVPSLHEAPAAFCNAKGCHLTSLTKEHYRYTSGGSRLNCATCHASTDATVKAAIASGSTACTSCHDLSKFTHPGTGVAHAASNTCVAAGCHVTDVTTIHKGNCAACHAAGKTASTTCSTCHTSGTYHVNMNAAHSLPQSDCRLGGCHPTDAALEHKNVCTRCHAADKTPSTNCVTCHTTPVLSLHPNAVLAHTAAATFCTASSCHGTAVTTIHGAPGGPGCAACHAVGKTPSTVCSSCHASDIATVHSSAAAKHASSDATCIGSSCHKTDVSLIHDEVTGPGCIACHSESAPPTKQCGTCHPQDIPTVHAKAGVSHTALNVTCVTAGCHPMDVTEIHKVDGQYRCMACHADFKTPTTQCSACHPGDVTSLHSAADPKHVTPPDMCATVCHATNVATIHAAKPGCVACHAGGITPSTQCASCHTGGVRDYHATAIVLHSAPTGACVTAGCHNGDVINLHDAGVPGSGCDSCHGAGKTPSLDCASCHGSDIRGLHSYAAAAHQTQLGLTCVDAVCHESNVMSIHDHPGGPSCAACHAAGKTPSIDCSTCHPGAVETVHSTSQEPHTVTNGCSTNTCHASRDLGAIHTLAPNNCATCHRAGVTPIAECGQCHLPSNIVSLHYKADLQHTGTLTTCVAEGCHGSNVATLHQPGPGCNLCHAPGAPTSVNCTNAGCHSSSVNTVHAKAAIAHVALSGYCVRAGCHGGDLTSIHYANGTGPNCTACHGPGKTPSGTCTNCHPATEAEVHVLALDDHAVTQTTCAGYGISSPCHHSRVDSTHRTAPNGCRSCHATGVTPSVVCANCHTGATAPTHTSATVLHTATGGICANAQCHPLDVAAIHVKSTQSCLACHGPTATPSTTCSTCHTEDPLVRHAGAAAAHVSPVLTCTAAQCHDNGTVTAIHSKTGCAACHAPDKTATTNCISSTCHGKDFTLIHLRGDASHAVSTTCVRSGCHSGNAVDLHKNGPGCAACHRNPNHAASVVCGDCHIGANPQVVHAPYVGTKHDPVLNACTSIGCHNQSVASTHNAPAGTYGPNPGPGCTPCHTTGPLTTDCVTCHALGGQYAPTHASAETSHTAPTGTCVKSGCHASNVTVLHVKNGVRHCEACHNNTGYPSLDCQGCHFTDFTTQHPAPPEKHTTTALNAQWCTNAGCHDKNLAIAHTKTPTSIGCAACHATGKTLNLDCSTSGCHPASVPNNHPAPAVPHTSTDGCTTLCHTSNVATLHAVPAGTGVTPPGCVACHAYGKTHSTTCSQCHASGTYHGAAAAKHVAPAVTCTAAGCHSQGDVSLIHVKTGISHCEACHAAGKVPTTDCTACHAGGGDHIAAHAECNGCHGSDHWGGPYVGVSDCYSCHGSGPKTWYHPGTCHGCMGGQPYSVSW